MKTGLDKFSRQTTRQAANRSRGSNREQAAGTGPLQRRIDASATMQRQREQIEKSFARPAQRVGEEDEELLQGRFTRQLQGDLEEEELLQGRFEGPVQQQAPEEEELMQGKFPSSPQRETEASPNLTGMPDNLKRGLESLSGMDMSDLRVHYNSAKPAQLNALAYAQGSDIHLGPGQERHLPHEAWHTVQQRQGRVTPTMTLNGEKVNDDAGLEKEADVMGDKASRHG